MACLRDKNRAMWLLSQLCLSALGCTVASLLVAQTLHHNESIHNNVNNNNNSIRSNNSETIIGLEKNTSASAREFSLPAQSLAAALLQFSQQAGIAIYSSAPLLEGLQAPAVSGRLIPAQALDQLLHNSGLEFVVAPNNAVMIRAKPAAAPAAAPPIGSSALEEVRVSGMRWSLQQALQQKRSANVVSDVIASESLGKFPDTNVVESLQRMTGVAITRTRAGDGQFITVRGMGQQFNRVTLNGVELATDNIGREFSFDVFPAELIAEAHVLKSPSASQYEGAIGATVDMRTQRPLAASEKIATLSLGGGYDELSAHWGEKLSAAYSNHFMDERLGVLLGFSHSRRHWRSDMAQSLGMSFDASYTQNGKKIEQGFDLDGDGIIHPQREVGFQRPGYIAYPLKWGERERSGLVGTVEYQVSDELHTALDFFYGKFTTPEQASYQTNNFYYQFAPGSIVADENKTITHFVIEDYFVELAADPKNRRVETQLWRWQNQWQAHDQLALSTSLGYSGARRPEGGDTKFWVAGVPGARVEYWARVPVPELKITLSDGRDIAQLRGDELQVGFMETKGDDIKDDYYSLQLDGNYQVDAEFLRSVDLGLALQQRVKDRRAFSSRNKEAYSDHPFSFGQLQGSPLQAVDDRDFLAGQAGVLPRSWPALDVDKIYALLRQADGQFINSKGEFYNSDDVLPQFNPSGSSAITETTQALYSQWNLESASQGWRANLGLRWVNSRTDSSGAINEVEKKELIGSGPNYQLFTRGTATPLRVETQTRVLLPSANLTIDLTRDSLLRFALARTLARPSLAQLGMETSYEVSGGEQRLSRLGNPYLKPVMATQIDISSEWYVSPQSALTFAVFSKGIEDFVANRVDTETILGEDFQVTQPVNNDRATIIGSEFSLQKLWANGMGIQFNHTLTHSYTENVINPLIAAYGLENLSKYSYNLVGLYEKNKLSARLALNYRSDYLQATTGQASRPEIVDAYRQLDFSASYQLNSAAALYVEAINLLDEPRFVYSEFSNRLIEYEVTGRRYFVGLRFTL